MSDIDHDDTRFQFRLTLKVGDLKQSLSTNGQQAPVVLWGSRPPYVIIDGSRRLSAMRELGWTEVRAIIRDDLDEEQAFTLSFIENVKRRSFSVWDRANAVWQAIHVRGLSNEKVAEELGLSERQIRRYGQILDLHPTLRDALGKSRISMAHAALLHRARIKDLAGWVEIVHKEELSTAQVRARLGVSTRQGRPRTYLRTEKDGFRMYPFRFRSDMTDKERSEIAEALKRALSLVMGAE